MAALISFSNRLYVPGEPTANGRAVTAFNDAVVADPRVAQVLVPLRDGLTLVRRVSDGHQQSRRLDR